MNDLIREYLPVIEYLASLTEIERVAHMKHLEPSCVRFLIDLVLNVECGKCYVPPEIVEKLRKSKRKIRSLVKKNKSFTKRKKELSCKGIFADIYVPLIPVLRSLVNQ